MGRTARASSYLIRLPLPARSVPSSALRAHALHLVTSYRRHAHAPPLITSVRAEDEGEPLTPARKPKAARRMPPTMKKAGASKKSTPEKVADTDSGSEE